MKPTDQAVVSYFVARFHKETNSKRRAGRTPDAKTVRKGMSGWTFNKAVDSLRVILEIAREQGTTLF